MGSQQHSAQTTTQIPSQTDTPALTYIALALLVAVTLFATTTSARGDIYVYEVNTVEKRYITVSQLLPDAYLYYNGGDDIIAELKVLKTYPNGNGNYQKAMSDYNIQGNNYGPLPPQDAQHNLSFRPYIWWR